MLPRQAGRWTPAFAGVTNVGGIPSRKRESRVLGLLILRQVRNQGAGPPLQPALAKAGAGVTVKGVFPEKAEVG
ncbi:MAG: hypothetical protein A4E73_02299 [Syntrophaceae bacterium PtaU1.Bin231]|nr:MAG: hypothetical protein A4E73_02299 [Syntrophaceae bacterium PtaU1.Bin231]